jgi:hypothetical protein
MERAERALDEFREATSYAAAESAWTDLLLASGTFFSKLEQGAKGASSSEYWFGLKKHQRKTDPVLRYIHMAVPRQHLWPRFGVVI